MRSLARGVVDFVIGDDTWIAVAVLLLLIATEALTRVSGEVWWLLPLGVPASLWISLRRAQRRATSEMGARPR